MFTSRKSKSTFLCSSAGTLLSKVHHLSLLFKIFTPSLLVLQKPFCHHSLFKYCLTVLPNLMLSRCYLFPHFLYSSYPRIIIFKNYLQFLHSSSHRCFIFSSDSSHPNPSFYLMFIYSRVWTSIFPCFQPKTAEHFAKCLSNSTFGNETVSLSYIRILISKMSWRCRQCKKIPSKYHVVSFSSFCHVLVV